MALIIRSLQVGGETTEITAEGRLIRRCATFTCQHCGQIVDIPPGQYPEDVGGRCYWCWDVTYPLSGLICDRCVKKGTCDYHEHQLKTVLDAVEKKRTVAGYFSNFK